MQAPSSEPVAPISAGRTSRLVDLREARERFGLSPRQIYRAVERGDVHAVPSPEAPQRNFGKRIYYPEWELIELKNRLARGVGGRRRVALQLVLGIVSAASFHDQPAGLPAYSHPQTISVESLGKMTVIASKRRRFLAAA